MGLILCVNTRSLLYEGFTVQCRGRGRKLAFPGRKAVTIMARLKKYTVCLSANYTLTRTHTQTYTHTHTHIPTHMNASTHTQTVGDARKHTVGVYPRHGLNICSVYVTDCLWNFRQQQCTAQFTSHFKTKWLHDIHRWASLNVVSGWRLLYFHPPNCT